MTPKRANKKSLVRELLSRWVMADYGFIMPANHKKKTNGSITNFKNPQLIG